METIEIELTSEMQTSLLRLSKILRLSREKAIKKLLRDVTDAMEKDPSLTAKQAIRLVVSRYIK